MKVQAISSCACHGKICTMCDHRVAVLQIATSLLPTSTTERPSVHENLCQECATRVGEKLIEYAKRKPYRTLRELKERQGIRT